MYVSLCWSLSTSESIRRSPLENVAYEFILTSLSVSSMSSSSYLNGLSDERQVAVQLLFYGMLLPGFIPKYVEFLCCSHLDLFSKHFIGLQMMQPYNSTNTVAARKKFFVILWEVEFSYERQTVNSSSRLYTHVDITFSTWDTAAKVCEMLY